MTLQPHTDTTVTLVIERWQIRPEAKWIPHNEMQIPARMTAKRIYAHGKVFDRATGHQIARSIRGWYRTSIKINQEQVA